MIGTSFLTKCCVHDPSNATPNCADTATANSNVGATWVGSTQRTFIRIALSTPCSASDWVEFGAGGGGSFNSFIISDGSTTETINDGNTLLFATDNSLQAVVSATDTVTHSVVLDGVSGGGDNMASVTANGLYVNPSLAAPDGVVTAGTVSGGNIDLTRSVGGNVTFALGSINEHSDVDTTTTAPIDGDVLTWVNANSRWEPLAASGGGGGSADAAINGTSENVNAFSTVTYSSFDVADSVTQSWLTPAATNQTITEAGQYIVTFSVVDGTTGADFTIKPSRAIGVATIKSYRGTGSFSGTFLLDWTATDVTNGDSVIFVATNNAGSIQSVTLNASFAKYAAGAGGGGGASGRRPWVKIGDLTADSSDDVLETDEIWHTGRVVVGASTFGSAATNFEAGDNVAFGVSHTFTAGPNSSILGGNSNTMNSLNSVICGGLSNSISGAVQGNVIAGGNTNSITGGSRHSIGGGELNVISSTGNDGVIGGGSGNVISGSGSDHTIGGGLTNSITSGLSSVVGGGANNTTAGNQAVIAGGSNNQVVTSFAFIGGGVNHITNSLYNVICGGDNNETTGTYSAIVGGHNNTITGTLGEHFIGGGEDNTISGGTSNTIAGGKTVTITGGNRSFVGCGETINISSSYGVIGGGQANTISSVDGTHNVIVGGESNTISATIGSTHNFIGGGESHLIDGNTADYNVIGGGFNNTITNGSVNTVFGQEVTVTAENCFAWNGDATPNTLTVATNNTFVAKASGGVTFWSDAGATTGVNLAAGATAWAVASSRKIKENLEELGHESAIERLLKLHVYTGNYVGHEEKRLFVVAEEWDEAYGDVVTPSTMDVRGEDVPTINTNDIDVAVIAALQGALLKIEQLEKRIAELEG